jgi:hypothetical protein
LPWPASAASASNAKPVLNHDAAGAFAPDRPDEDIKTITFNHHIVARKTISEATIAALTRQIFAVRQHSSMAKPKERKDTQATLIAELHTVHEARQGHCNVICPDRPSS